MNGNALGLKEIASPENQTYGIVHSHELCLHQAPCVQLLFGKERIHTPPPQLIMAPVWLYMFGCTANEASINQQIVEDLSHDRVRERE